MKFCPKCNAHYEDSMFFCLEDGQPLNSTDSAVQVDTAAFDHTLTPPTEEKTASVPTQSNQIEEKTLDFPTGEKTLALPIINELSEKETRDLPEERSIATKVWQTTQTDDKSVLGSFTESIEGGDRSRFFLGGAVLGGIALLGTLLGAWWLSQSPTNEIALGNVKKSEEKISLGVSNSNLSGVFENSNANVSTNVSTGNSNSVINTKPTPKTSPTASKDDKISSTPTPQPTPEANPTSQPTATSNPESGGKSVSIQKTPTPNLSGGSTPPPVPKVVSAGVVNGKAVDLVKPPYPPAAKAIRASGAVNVQVTIDENGNVISARAVSGHALLRSAAETAARASKFSPTVVNGQKVKVTGVVVYTFTLQ